MFLRLILLQLTFATGFLCPSSALADRLASPNFQSPSSIGPTEGCHSCECEYKKNKCDEFKGSLPEAQRTKVMSCAQAQSEKLDNWRTVGCLHGLADSTILALVNTTIAAGEIISQDRECNANPSAKLMLLRPVYKFYQPDMLKSMVNSWTCGSIRREVQNKQTSLEKIYDAKRREIKLSADGRGNSLDDEELDRQVKATLAPNEREYFQSFGKRADPLNEMIKKYGNVWNCYSPYERTRLYCSDAADAAMAVAAVAGLSKAAAKSVARELGTAANSAERAAGLAASAERAGAAGVGRSVDFGSLDAAIDNLRAAEMRSQNALRASNQADDAFATARRSNQGNWRGALANDPAELSTEAAANKARKTFLQAMSEKGAAEDQFYKIIDGLNPNPGRASFASTRAAGQAYRDARASVNWQRTSYSPENLAKTIAKYKEKYIPEAEARLAKARPSDQQYELSSLESSRAELTRLEKIAAHGYESDPQFLASLEKLRRAEEELRAIALNSPR